MKLKTSAVLMLPSLTILAASLQAADVNPSWVEYTPVSASPASDAAKTAPVVSAPDASAPPAAAATAVTTEGASVAATVPIDTATGQPVVGAAPTETAAGDVETVAMVAPRVFAFDYFKGANSNLPQYLERYDYREGFNGDTRSGVYADADFNIGVENQDRDLFTLERRGFGPNNHRGMARFNDDEMTLSGAYSHYRSATGGVDYLYSPAVVPGADNAPFDAGFGGNQTFAAPVSTDYHIDRTTYAAGFKLKPSLLGGMTLAVDYEGYKREGNQLATTIVMAGGGPVDSWRGTSLNIDERMNRVGLSLSASPKGMFDIAYDAAIEKFTSGSADLTRNDITGESGSNRQALSPFYFVPDASLLTQNLRIAKRFDDRAVIAAGIGYSTLTDENSPERFTATFGSDGGPDAWEGEINSTTAYLTGNANVSPAISVEGHIKYYSRENDSSFPVDHVIAPSGANARMAGPRINSIDSMDYGLAANWRPGVMSSNVTLGWKRIDRERDLTYANYSEGIPANRIFYREDTLSDEVYLKWTARPALGWNVRLTPSYTWADKTGLITEPEEAVKVNAMVSYAAPAGWLVSGFYDYKNKQNDDLYVTSDTTGSPPQFNQDVESTFHAAGVTLNVLPHETVNTSLSLYWMQNDLSSYLLSTNFVRQTGNLDAGYTTVGLSNYKVDSYVLNLGTDWQASDKLKLSGSYSLTRNKGDTASGAVLAALQAATGTIDSSIDNTLHSVSLGADYSLTDTATLRANYIYDYYDDNAYSLLTGGVHTLAVGVSFAM